MSTSRGRMGAYAWWQGRDYAMGPGLGTFIITALVSIAPIFAGMRAMANRGIEANPAEMVDPFFATFLQFIALVGPIMAVGSMVSADRAPGLARFLFAKPIDVTRYYVQMWLVRGAGLLAITAILSWTVHFFIAPVPWGAAVLGMAITWLLLGGVGFLFSVLLPRDSVYVIGLYATTTLLQQFTQIAPEWAWVPTTLRVLPPMHKLGGIRSALLDSTPMVWNDLWHVVGWGAGSLLLGAYLLRRLPLVR